MEDNLDRNLWIALPNLQRLQKQLGIPNNVTEDALRIYTQTVKEKLTMERSIDTLLSASIYAALWVHGIPKSVEEMTKVAQVSKENVLMSTSIIFTDILPKLGMKVQDFDDKLNNLN
ncbi:MAG: hypothetical protein ACW986_13375 [Promethearchaeota archaeon]|jgi:transcription initiation factor TFIIB